MADFRVPTLASGPYVPPPPAPEQTIPQRFGGWLDDAIRRYGGPHLSAALMGTPAGGQGYGQPARGGLLQGMAELSPGADVRDMLQGSGELMQGALQGRGWDAAQGAGLLGAATLGAFVPGSAGGYRQAAQEVAEEVAPQGIRAYHGSPHSFDEFSTENIGTGEGAQAYGHGLYFAESEGVAKSYRDALAKTGGVTAEDTAARILESTGGDYNKALAEANTRFNRALSQGKMEPEAYQKMLEVNRLLLNETPLGGSMYEVNIRANPEDFLDWDAPLSEQPTVLDAIDRTWGDPEIVLTQLGGLTPETSGGDFISALQGLGQSNTVGASERLRTSGIPGIRYYDAVSRGAEEGTRNYVVFDDSLIDIIRKYGILAPLVGGGAAGLTYGQTEEDSTL